MITDLAILKLSKEPLELHELTKNVIILFNNSDLKYKFVQEFCKISLGDEDSVGYSTVGYGNDWDEHNAELNQLIVYRPTTIYEVDKEQTFIFTTEAPFVFQCKDAYDLWFCDENEDGEIKIWAFSDFVGYKEFWEKGLDVLYANVIQGVFGCYEGYGR